MLDWRLAGTHFILAVTVMLWSSGKVLSVDVATEAFDSGLRDVQSPPITREGKSATDLAAKLMLLDELVSLENDVIETKKKKELLWFWLSTGQTLSQFSRSQRQTELGSFVGKEVAVRLPSSLPLLQKVVDHPKRRFGVPMDRIGGNRLSNSRG